MTLPSIFLSRSESNLERREVHLTDLLYCRNKVNRRTENHYVILGKLVHFGLENTLLATARCGVKIEQEKAVKVQVENEEWTVHYTPDVVINGKTKVIAEVKYVNRLPRTPHLHHEIQVQLYAGLEEASVAVLMYISPYGSRFFYFFTVPTRSQALSLIAELIETWEKEVPRWEWECKYCKACRGEKE